MITIYPDNYFAQPAIAVIAATTAVVSHLLIRRWNWKAIPLVIVVGLTVPVLLVLIAMVAMELLPDGQAIGFMAVGSDILGIGLLSALIGFAGTMLFARLRRREKS
jgi:hypothetical protein